MRPKFFGAAFAPSFTSRVFPSVSQLVACNIPIVCSVCSFELQNVSTFAALRATKITLPSHSYSYKMIPTGARSSVSSAHTFPAIIQASTSVSNSPDRLNRNCSGTFSSHFIPHTSILSGWRYLYNTSSRELENVYYALRLHKRTSYKYGEDTFLESRKTPGFEDTEIGAFHALILN